MRVEGGLGLVGVRCAGLCGPLLKRGLRSLIKLFVRNATLYYIN